jgi:predicted AlkP superfamily phosphohydrolase/phosphomutase
MKALDDHRLRASLYLIETHPADVMMFTFMSIDTVQHYFWHHMDKDHFIHDPNLAPKFGDTVRNVYERLDFAAGQIIDRLPHDTTVFVVSDHGGGPVVDRTIFLNRYLAQLGLLHYNEKAISGVRKLGKKILRLGFSLLRSTLTSRQKSRLAELLPKIRQKSEMAYSSFTSIDWSRTKAYCSEVLASPPSIWINLKGIKPQGIVDPAEYNTLIEFILEKLAELKDPRTGKPVIKRVYRRNEIFQGPFAHEGADLVLDWWSEDSLFSAQPSFPEDTNKPALIIREHRPSEKSEWGGTHRLYGIVIAGGPAFRSGAEIANARLIDIGPTILHLLDVPVPEDMDGKVLASAFQPDFLAAKPVRSGAASGTSATDRPSGYSDEEAAKVEERLQALGYLE